MFLLAGDVPRAAAPTSSQRARKSRTSARSFTMVSLCSSGRLLLLVQGGLGLGLDVGRPAHRSGTSLIVEL